MFFIQNTDLIKMSRLVTMLDSVTSHLWDTWVGMISLEWTIARVCVLKCVCTNVCLKSVYVSYPLYTAPCRSTTKPTQWPVLKKLALPLLWYKHTLSYTLTFIHNTSNTPPPHPFVKEVQVHPLKQAQIIYRLLPPILEIVCFSFSGCTACRCSSIFDTATHKE